ncbi:TonB family protein [Hyphococcus luteus]|uniref:TonB C-terminal domain-containing protein n=1 Tax=Hyphococcus luteus TaxID=2058213 RepID=A0A2S7K685_9PROT|nr:TonB family protein [Marinicaulis flavus]PQA87986.1 hypothetical protein CW354_06525 [Marinicaulis flavus]
MAQDKVAEIIDFKGGAGAPAGGPAPNENAPALAEAEHAGALLAAAREAAGLSVDEVSEAIKVKAAHLAAIEVLRADLLPALPYASGFVKSYARYLGLDADAVAARFRAEVAAIVAQGGEPEAAPQEPAYAASSGGAASEGARLATVFALLAVLLFVMWVGYQVLSGAGNEPAERPNIVVSNPSAPRPSLMAPAVRPEAESPGETAQPADEAMEDAAPASLPEDQSAAEPQAGAADEAVEDAVEDGGAETADVSAAPAPSAPASQASASETQASETQASETRATEPQVNEIQAGETPSRDIRSSETSAAPRVLPRRPRPAPPVVEEASLTHSVAPEYPERCARGADTVESVTVMFDVSAAGRAVHPRIVTSTDSCFNEEALRALDRWRFSPRTVDGAASLETGKSATLNFRK